MYGPRWVLVIRVYAAMQACAIAIPPTRNSVISDIMMLVIMGLYIKSNI